MIGGQSAECKEIPKHFLMQESIMKLLFVISGSDSATTTNSEILLQSVGNTVCKITPIILCRSSSKLVMILIILNCA